MAKLKSLIKVEGTLDDLTFYKGKQGYLVRRKGGVSKERIENDPAFVRTRENGTEFGHCATAGKMLRRAILPLLSRVKDSEVIYRLVKVLSEVKNADLLSPRGERQVAIGLATPEGKAFLKGFDFNGGAPISTVLRADFTLDPLTGEVSIPDLIPEQNVSAPQGATHFSMTSGFLNLDFASAEKDLQLSPATNLPMDNTATSVTLTPAAVPTGTGNEMFFINVEFFQEVNGVQYPLKNGAHNALNLIEVL